MPLLRSKPYVPDTTLPADLQPSEALFVVRATGEVFRDYECVAHAWRATVARRGT
jgi:hypothetical protein